MAGDVGAEDIGEVSELYCCVLKVELAIVLVVGEVDDVRTVDELELEEL